MKTMTTKNTGRIIGVLILAHMLTGLMIPYIVMRPLTIAPANFLSCAAGMALEVKLSVALLFIGGAIPIGITIMAWPLLRQRCHAMGLWLLSIGVVNLVLQAVENEHWLSMLFLSQQYAGAGSADTGFLQTLGMALRSEWKWAHYTHLLFAVTWMLLLYIIIYRLRLVPRVLAAFGLIAVVLQIVGITLPGLMSYSIPFSAEVYSLPLGVAYLSLILWVIIKGFKEPKDAEPIGEAGK
jgi:hypothetical protein